MTTARAPREIAAVYAFGRYETLFRIGTGGMAEVFAARLCAEAGFERLVAIKRLLPHLAEDPRHVARFLDEARLAARVIHPHVVQTLDLGRTDEGEPFLVLELIVGSSLDGLLAAEQRPPLPVLLSWIAQASEGLHAAHVARAPSGEALNLVHRDVSPHNILVGLDGDARIGDFGVAQAALLKSSRTPAGHLHGKFAYFSPEQALGRSLDARSDVFSLGIVAWEAVTGRPLFQADNPVTVIDRVRALQIPQPHRLVRGIPTRLSEVIMAALERDPTMRTQSAQAFARELAEVLVSLGGAPGATQRARHVRAVQHPVWQRLATPSQASVVQRGHARRARWLPRALAAVVLLALAGAAASAAWPSAEYADTQDPHPRAARAAPTTRAEHARDPEVISARPAPQTELEPVDDAPRPPRAKKRVPRSAVRRDAAPAPSDVAPRVSPWGGRS